MKYYLITFEIEGAWRSTTPWAGSIVAFLCMYSSVNIVWSCEITEDEYKDVMEEYEGKGRYFLRGAKKEEPKEQDYAWVGVDHIENDEID